MVQAHSNKLERHCFVLEVNREPIDMRVYSDAFPLRVLRPGSILTTIVKRGGSSSNVFMIATKASCLFSDER